MRDLMELQVQEVGNVAPYWATITKDDQFIHLLKPGATIRGSMMAWLCLNFAIIRAQISVNVDILFDSGEFILTVIEKGKR